MTSLMCIIPGEIDQFLSQCERIKAFGFGRICSLLVQFGLHTTSNYTSNHTEILHIPLILGQSLQSLSKLTKEEWQCAICSIYRYEAQ